MLSDTRVAGQAQVFLNLRPVGTSLWGLFLHGENPGPSLLEAVSPEYLRLKAAEAGFIIVDDLAAWAHDNIAITVPVGKSPADFIREWSIEESDIAESLFIKRLRASRLTDQQIVSVIVSLTGLCRQCFARTDMCMCSSHDRPGLEE